MTPQHTVRKLERVAYHEAGHAVAACLFSMPLRAVTIVPGPRDSSGGRVLGSVALGMQSPPNWANPWLPEFEPKRGRRYIAQNIQMTLAGALAETLHTRCWQQPAEHAGNDDESLALHIGRPLNSTPKATRDWVNRLRFQTLETLRTPDVWAAVDGVARELVRRNTLKGAEVRELVSRAPDAPALRKCAKRS
jgi:hypothetical protein